MSASGPAPAPVHMAGIMSEAEIRPRFMGFAADEVTRGSLARVAEALGEGAESVLPGDLGAAKSALTGIVTPRVLVIDAGQEADLVSAVGAFADVCDPGTQVVVLGAVNDVSVYRQLTALGVQDYLVKPVSADVLEESLRGQLAGAADGTAGVDPEGGPAAVRRGVVAAVTGARGGAGATTLAVNLAAAFAGRGGLRVALVDMDMTFGTVALSLDLEPGRGFLDALRQPERIDSLFIERAMTRSGEHLFVLAAEEDPRTPPVYADESLDVLFTKLRESFDVIVVDAPRADVLSLQGHADQVLLVTDPTLAGLRDGIRLKSALEAGAPDKSLIPVLNRGALGRKGELKNTHFSEEAGYKPRYVLEADSKSVNTAAAVGRAVTEMAPKVALSKVVADVAKAVLPPEETAAKRSILTRLLKGNA